MDWVDLLAVQGSLRSLLQHHSPEASILQHPALTSVQDHWKRREFVGDANELQPLTIMLWSILGKGLRKVQTPDDVMAGCISTAISPGVSTEQPDVLCFLLPVSARSLFQAALLESGGLLPKASSEILPIVGAKPPWGRNPKLSI